MKLFISILVSMLILSFSAPISAVETTKPVISGDYFDVEIIQGTQSAWTKSVPLEIRFRANVTAKRVEISWDVPVGVKFRKSHPQFISVKEGEVYSYKAFVTPITSGVYTISGNIIRWEVDTNYSSSAYASINFDKDLITIPETPGYSSAVLMKNLVLGLIYIAIALGLFFLFKLALEKLKVWLKPPE